MALNMGNVSSRMQYAFTTNQRGAHMDYGPDAEPLGDSTSEEESSIGEDEKDGFFRPKRTVLLQRMTKRDVRSKLLSAARQETLGIPVSMEYEMPFTFKKWFGNMCCTTTAWRHETPFTVYHYVVYWLGLIVCAAGIFMPWRIFVPNQTPGSSQNWVCPSVDRTVTVAVTECERAYAMVACLLVYRSSSHFLEAYRNGSLRAAVAHGHLPPEAHFLAGNLPGSIAAHKIYSFGGFFLGLIAVFFGIWQMDTTETGGVSRKLLLIETILYLLSTNFGKQNMDWDRFALKVWEDEIEFDEADGSRGNEQDHVNRHSSSPRVIHAIRNLVHAFSYKPNTTNMFPIMLMWLLIFLLSVGPIVWSIIIVVACRVSIITLPPIIVGGLTVIDVIANLVQIIWRYNDIYLVARVLEGKVNTKLLEFPTEMDYHSDPRGSGVETGYEPYHPY